MSAGARFYFKPALGESVEASVNIEPEESAAVLGTVCDSSGKTPVPGALALLFRCGECKTLIDRQLTDDDGQFFFGPLESGVLYLIKIYKNNIKLRELEIAAD